MSQNEILSDIRKSVQEHRGDKPVAAVFDLDSTLFCVSPRTEAILHRLLKDPAMQERFPGELKQLGKAKVLPTDWGIKTVLQREGLKATIEFFEAVRKFWSKRFFTNEFLHHDIIYPGANDYVRSLKEAGARVFYLTGRNRGNMFKGTVEGLKRFDFPLEDVGFLHMKPSDHDSDEDFKTTWFRNFVKDYSEVYFFENEPLIIHQVRSAVPEVKIVFMDSTQSGKAEKPSDIPKIGMDYR